MPERKFLISLRCDGQRIESVGHRPVLSRVSPRRENRRRYNHLDRVQFHKAAQVNAGTQGDCHLQLWELDFYRLTRYRQNEEHEFRNPRRNQLLGSIPGVVVRRGRKFRFQPTGNPVLIQQSPDPLNGSVKLTLLPAGGDDEQDYVFPLSEYEGVLELAAVLRTNAQDNQYENYRRLPPYQVRNVKASLLRQIHERGGFAMAFVANYDPEATTPPQRLPDNASEAEKAEYQYQLSLHNEQAEFHRQAEQMICVLPTFRYEGGEVRMGYYRIHSKDEIANHMRDTRQGVQQFLQLAQPPRVAFVGLYGHASRQQELQMVYEDWGVNGNLRLTNCAGFVSQIRMHLANQVVMPLFGCSLARGKWPNPDNRFGRAYPCEELGGDSLGWTLQRELQQQLEATRQGERIQVTVWTHTTAHHTTRNWRLRVFSTHGSSDVINSLVQAPRLSAVTVQAYDRPFDVDNISTRTHNRNFIRTMSVQDALYLPWRWNGGTDATAATPNFNRELNQQADAVYDELRSLGLSGAQGQAEHVKYEGPNRRFITGLQPGRANAQLSQHFSYNELRNLADPFRIKVQLMKSVQLLRYRARRPRRARRRLGPVGISPVEIRQNGQCLVVMASPNTQPNRRRLGNKAQEMVQQGLFTAAAWEGERLVLTHVD